MNGKSPFGYETTSILGTFAAVFRFIWTLLMRAAVLHSVYMYMHITVKYIKEVSGQVIAFARKRSILRFLNIAIFIRSIYSLTDTTGEG